MPNVIDMPFRVAASVASMTAATVAVPFAVEAAETAALAGLSIAGVAITPAVAVAVGLIVGTAFPIALWCGCVAGADPMARGMRTAARWVRRRKAVVTQMTPKEIKEAFAQHL